jgi:hypothetical protein
VTGVEESRRGRLIWPHIAAVYASRLI